MRTINRILPTVLVVAVLSVSQLATAINYGGIGGRPANPIAGNPRTQSIFIYELKPGQETTDGVLVENNTGQSQTIALDAVDSEIASGGNFTCKQAAEPKQDVGAWISLQSPEVTVSPNNSVTVPFTISVPTDKNVSVGEHDGCVTLQAVSQTATPSDKSGIVLSFRSAIRVVVTIPGKIIKKLSITNVRVNSGKNGTYQITPAVVNEGNVSLDTTMSVGLKTVFGLSVPLVKKGTTPILPRDTASSSYSVKRPFWGGLYRAHIVAVYNDNPSTQLGLGQNSNQQTIVKDSAVFFAVPAPGALVVELALLLLILAVGYWLFVMKRQARHLKQYWGPYTVKKGETIQTLSEKHHISWQKIAKVNKLKPPYHVRKGDTLKLPTNKE